MKGLLDYDLIVQALIQDGARKLDQPSRYEAIRAAVQEHSRVLPYVKRRSLVGTGGVVGTPTGWIDNVSGVARLEYPIHQVPRTYLGSDQYALVSSPTAPTTFQIQFLYSTPASGERFNLEWTVPHTITDHAGTISDEDYRSVAVLGASYACLQLAGFYAQAGDATIAIDSQDPQSKSANYRALAAEYRKRYRLAFGLGPDDQGADVVGAGVYVPLTRKTTYGSEYFVHTRWRP